LLEGFMTPADDVTLWFRAPAAVWEEALPLGTGRLGAMCFGGVDTERIQLNDDRLWSGGPSAPVTGDPEILARARASALAGEHARAERLVRQFQGPDTAEYLPLADLLLDVRVGGGRPESYRRRLNLRTGVCTVDYRQNGVAVLREAVCHPRRHALAVRVTIGRDGVVDLVATLESALGGVVTEDDGVVGISGTAPDGGMAFAVAAAVQVDGPDAVTVYVTSEVGYRGHDVPPSRDSGECLRIARDRACDLRRAGWRDFRRESVAEHQELFDRVRLDLGAAPDLPTDERLTTRADDPSMAALLFQYGRYLLITSSRPGTLPANLQGIWNPHVHPPWRGNYTLNINTQMNYWAAESTGLPECHEPLLEFVERLAGKGTEVARALYDAPGWVAHHNSDPWGLAAPVGEGHGDPAWAFWPMAAAWLSQHLWEHYAFGGDREWLRDRAWPVIRDAAAFCVAWLVEHEGSLTTAPSTSPENHFVSSDGEVVAVGVGSTMDLALIWELFTHSLEAAEVLGLEFDPLVRRIRAHRAALAAPGIGSHGRIREWAQDVPEVEPDHRHLSHLFGLHPGRQITPERRPALAAAARRTLVGRGDAGTGWSLAWKMNLWARLGDGARAHRLLRMLLTDVTTDDAHRGGVYRNLLCAHPPFQIDGNLGATAAIAEMLLQSHTGELWLLPALPPEWRQGSVHGLRARGAVVVDLSWQDGLLRSAAVRTTGEAKTVVIRYGERRVWLPLRKGRRHMLDSRLDEVSVLPVA
jgi:alpha-L-fucosidase 2